MENKIKELEGKVNEKAIDDFGINYGWAKAIGTQEIADRTIVPIAVYKNRDHGVDPAVVKIEFYEIGETPKHLKDIALDYPKPTGNFYSVFPKIKLAERGSRVEAKIEIVNSKYIGFRIPFGNQYKYKTLDKKTIEL